MDREKAIAEIARLANEHLIPILIFPQQQQMMECMEDMRRGANIRVRLKQMGLPVDKELLI